MQEMWKWVQSLGREDPLEKEMATHSSILVRKISWTQEPGGLQLLLPEEQQQWSHSTPDIFHQPLHSKISLKEYLWLPSLFPYFMSTQKCIPIWLPLTPTSIPNPTKIRLSYGFYYHQWYIICIFRWILKWPLLCSYLTWHLCSILNIWYCQSWNLCLEVDSHISYIPLCQDSPIWPLLSQL